MGLASSGITISIVKQALGVSETNLGGLCTNENIKGYLDPENLQHINDILCQFEEEHGKDRGKGGKYLIKEEYKKRFLN